MAAQLILPRDPSQQRGTALFFACKIVVHITHLVAAASHFVSLHLLLNLLSIHVAFATEDVHYVPKTRSDVHHVTA